jgi:riboflavin kinase/FMN adenylyltransferase
MKFMRVLTGLDAVAHPPTRAVVTVGVFDGLHRAHKQVVQSTVQIARRLKGTSLVITFDPDPQLILDPAHAQPVLMPLEARLVHLRALGVDWVWVIPFTKRFARVTAEQFIRRILIHRLHAAALVVGETFVFGRNRGGDMDVLRALGPPHGMRVVPVRQMRREGAPISSSRIRGLIARGQLALARGLLGRAPELYGTVVHGAGRGRQLGFPTANIRLVSQVLPPRGVYAVVAQSLDHRQGWRGVMNLGVRPTFGPGPLVCEVHLLGFSGRLLGRNVSVSLLARLRNERCFPNPLALSRQLRRDLNRARDIFSRLT